MHYATEHPRLQDYDTRLNALSIASMIERNDPFINPNRLAKLCTQLGVTCPDADELAVKLAAAMPAVDSSEGKNAQFNQETRTAEILVDMLIAA